MIKLHSISASAQSKKNIFAQKHLHNTRSTLKYMLITLIKVQQHRKTWHIFLKTLMKQSVEEKFKLKNKEKTFQLQDK